MKRFAKWNVIAAAALVLAVSTAGCTSNIVGNASPSPSPSPSLSAAPQPTRDPNFVPKTLPGYLTYSNSSADFTIQYPPSWQVEEELKMATFRFGTPYRAFVHASESYRGTAITFDNYTQDRLLSIKQSLTDFKLLSSSNITLAGYPAKQYVFTYVSELGAPSQGIDELTLVDSIGYEVSYGAIQEAYPTTLESAQNMMQSFNIVS
jgi:hypothetical protein